MTQAVTNFYLWYCVCVCVCVFVLPVRLVGKHKLCQHQHITPYPVSLFNPRVLHVGCRWLVLYYVIVMFWMGESHSN